jgi:hypothetical protein
MTAKAVFPCASEISLIRQSLIDPRLDEDR